LSASFVVQILYVTSHRVIENNILL